MNIKKVKEHYSIGYLLEVREILVNILPLRGPGKYLPIIPSVGVNFLKISKKFRKLPKMSHSKFLKILVTLTHLVIYWAKRVAISRNAYAVRTHAYCRDISTISKSSAFDANFDAIFWRKSRNLSIFWKWPVFTIFRCFLTFWSWIIAKTSRKLP